MAPNTNRKNLRIAFCLNLACNTNCPKSGSGNNDGFVSVERYQSLTDPTKLLSLSCDEAAVQALRESSRHRATQAKGRAGEFLDCRLRIASVVRDYGMNDRAEAPVDSRAIHRTSSGLGVRTTA